MEVIISMAIIYETKNFNVEAVEKPHITRTDGGHIKISPKIRVANRQSITPKQSVELMWVTTLVGEAMTTALTKRGIKVGRINYQDNGNWTVFKPEGSYLHIHLYGRAKNAKIQPYGQACFFPHREEKPEFYEKNEPLDENDVTAIKEEIKLLLKEDKYKKKNWLLV